MPAGRAGAGAGPAAAGSGGFGGAEGIDIEDLFGGMFAGRGGRGWGPIPGADQEAELELTVEEAYRGGRRSITLAGPDGPRQYEVNIPPGVTDGQRIRLAGQGGAGQRRRPRPATSTWWCGSRRTPATGSRAATSTSTCRSRRGRRRSAPPCAVDTPGGEAKVKVPPGTSSGRRLRLRGRACPTRAAQPGDLYAEVRIMVPAPAHRRGAAAVRGAGEAVDLDTFDPRRRPR